MKALDPLDLMHFLTTTRTVCAICGMLPTTWVLFVVGMKVWASITWSLGISKLTDNSWLLSECPADTVQWQPGITVSGRYWEEEEYVAWLQQITLGPKALVALSLSVWFSSVPGCLHYVSPPIRMLVDLVRMSWLRERGFTFQASSCTPQQLWKGPQISMAYFMVGG